MADARQREDSATRRQKDREDERVIVRQRQEDAMKMVVDEKETQVIAIPSCCPHTPTLIHIYPHMYNIYLPKSQRLLEADKRRGLELEMTKMQLAMDQAHHVTSEWKDKYDFMKTQGSTLCHYPPS